MMTKKRLSVRRISHRGAAKTNERLFVKKARRNTSRCRCCCVQRLGHQEVEENSTGLRKISMYSHTAHAGKKNIYVLDGENCLYMNVYFSKNTLPWSGQEFDILPSCTKQNQQILFY